MGRGKTTNRGGYSVAVECIQHPGGGLDKQPGLRVLTADLGVQPVGLPELRVSRIGVLGI